MGPIGLTPAPTARRTVFSSTKKQFLDLAESTGLSDEIRRANFFDDDEATFKAVRARIAAHTAPAH